VEARPLIVALTIAGQDLDPDAVGRQLGWESTRSRLSEGSSAGSWRGDVEETTDDVEAVVCAVLDRVLAVAAEWSEIFERYSKVCAYLVCKVDMRGCPADHGEFPMMVFEPDTLRKMADLRLVFVVEFR